MYFRAELAKWGYNKGNSIDVETLVDEILPSLFSQQENSYSEEDMIEASKYGYNFHKTTQFPKQEFEDSCIRNTQQWLEQFKKK